MGGGEKECGDGTARVDLRVKELQVGGFGAAARHMAACSSGGLPWQEAVQAVDAAAGTSASGIDRTVVVMRGVPGSGKSSACSIVEELRGPIVKCSADDFFLTPAGRYEFSTLRLTDAHSWCFTRFAQALAAGAPTVVVDNTATCLWEFEAYELAAVAAGYRVVLLELLPATEEEAARCGSRNRHAVPQDKVVRMWRRFERDPRAHRVQPLLSTDDDDARQAFVAAVLAALGSGG